MHLERVTTRSSEASIAGWIASNDVTLFTMVLVMVIAIFLHSKLNKGVLEQERLIDQNTTVSATLAATEEQLGETRELLGRTEERLNLSQAERDALQKQLVEKLAALTALLTGCAPWLAANPQFASDSAHNPGGAPATTKPAGGKCRRAGPRRHGGDRPSARRCPAAPNAGERPHRGAAERGRSGAAVARGSHAGGAQGEQLAPRGKGGQRLAVVGGKPGIAGRVHGWAPEKTVVGKFGMRPFNRLAPPLNRGYTRVRPPEPPLRRHLRGGLSQQLQECFSGD